MDLLITRRRVRAPFIFQRFVPCWSWHRRFPPPLRPRARPKRRPRSGSNPHWKAPRTAWGHPDLEGIWTTDDMRGVPMSRPQQFGTRLYLTDEEFAARAKQRQNAREHRRRQDRHVPQRGRLARLQLHVDGDRSGGWPRAGADARRTGATRVWWPGIVRRRDRGTRSRTSRSTTAASRAARSARSCRPSTATARASCRRRTRSSSATRWCTTRA